jgi:hypothetical protein
MIRRVLAVLAASIAVSGASATAALAQYPPSGAGGSVSATTTVPGGAVVFSGGGFKVGSDVTVAVNDAVYATIKANIVETAALGSSTAVHFSNAAYVRNAATTALPSASFSLDVRLQTAGSNLITGTGIDPTGKARVVSAKVTVTKAAGTPATNHGSTLPFTGSSVVVPGVVVALAMMGGGFLLLTSVRSRRAGQARS